MSVSMPSCLAGKASSSHKLPIQLKIALTVFVSVLIPVYLVAPDYGPQNFLYLCDIALFFTAVALWLESRLLLSMQAVGILVVQVLWTIDYLSHQVLGGSLFGLTSYAFFGSPIVRALTLFHILLPLLLLWIVNKVGYDRRAFVCQTLFTWLLLLCCYFFTDPKWNLNWHRTYLDATMGGLLTDRLPAGLEFVGQACQAYSNWRLSLAPALAEGINIASGLIMTALCLLLPAHLLLAKLFGGKRVLRQTQSASTQDPIATVHS
jgi:hypothetical protein